MDTRYDSKYPDCDSGSGVLCLQRVNWRVAISAKTLMVMAAILPRNESNQCEGDILRFRFHRLYAGGTTTC